MTAQAAERLEFEGRDCSMTFEPPLPKGHPRLREISFAIAAAQPKASQIIFSTACWRRYIGRWALREGRLYLLGFVPGSLLVLDGEEPLLADWFSGVIRLPHGEVLHYVHMGYASIYATEVHIKFEKGVEVARRVRDNRERALDPDGDGWAALPGMHNRFRGDDF